MVKKENVGVLISSHNLAELESFCTDVCLIKGGKIITSMSMEEIKKVDRTNYKIKLDSTDSLDDILHEDDVILDDRFVKVYVDEEEIPILINKLIKKKKKIYEIKEETLSLEDAFISKTGGNIID